MRLSKDCKVKVVNEKSLYYGRIGTVTIFNHRHAIVNFPNKIGVVMEICDLGSAGVESKSHRLTKIFK